MDELLADLNELWALVLEVWTASAFGIDVGKLLAAIGVLGVFWVLRGVLTNVGMVYLLNLAKRTETLWDDELVLALKPPISMIPIVVGLFFAIDILNIQEPYSVFATNIIRSAIGFVLFWALFRAVKPMSLLLPKMRRVLSTTMVDWLLNTVRGLFFFLGAATILEIWGIKVWPLLTGLGLFGVAVALGAQDLFKNLISGILILAERRFSPGDWVLVDGVVEGTVEKINFRSTTIRRFDKAPVQVPNASLSDTAVTNFSHMTHRRIYWIIGVEYRTSVAQLRAIRQDIEDYVLENADFAQPPAVATFVRIVEFNDSSIDIMLYCFTRTTDWGRWLEIKEQLAFAIKDIVERHGSAFAFPSRSVYVESVPGADRADVFVPPQEGDAGAGPAAGAASG